MAATTNLEWMLYHLLARDWVNEPRVTFHIAEGLLLYLQVGKFTLRCMHGDRIDYKGGILGLSTPVIKAVMKMNQTKYADLTLMGHYHSAYDFGNVIAATDSVTATLFLKGRQEIPTGTPGTEGTLTALTGYAVDPMALDSRIRQGTEGTVTWQGATHVFEVLGRNVIYGDDGFISTTLTAERGDDITILTETGRVCLTLFDPYHFEGDTSANDGRLTAMMPGRIVKLMAAAGDKVSKGQPLIIMEAMKMEHTIVSPRDGVVERVAFQVGEMVPADAVLFAFTE
jgi:biotin carboxyl carrier protein